MRNSRLADFIDSRCKHYNPLLNEADDPGASGPFPVDDSGQQDGQLPTPPPGPNDDPTETPEGETPDNEDGSYISSVKLSMYASLLLKAYTAKPVNDIPDQYRNVTSENANEVIKYIEDSLNMSQSQNAIADNLSQI